MQWLIAAGLGIPLVLDRGPNLDGSAVALVPSHQCSAACFQVALLRRPRGTGRCRTPDGNPLRRQQPIAQRKYR